MSTVAKVEVTRTVALKTFEDDGCWWVMLYEKFDPPTFPSGMPRSGNNVRFSGKTAGEAKKKALNFIRGAREALSNGLSVVK